MVTSDHHRHHGVGKDRLPVVLIGSCHGKGELRDRAWKGPRRGPPGCPEEKVILYSPSRVCVVALSQVALLWTFGSHARAVLIPSYSTVSD